MIVTGGNKGIGFSIVKLLAQNSINNKVILTSRNVELGLKAVADLALPNVSYMQLDICDKSSIQKFTEDFKQKYSNIDVLINNAAIAFKGDRFDSEVASITVNTNYFGTLQVIETLFPLLHSGSRIINIASVAGNLNIIKSNELKLKFTSPTLTIDELNTLMNQFIEDVKTNTYQEKGWPRSAYGVSKVGVIALTHILARNDKNIFVNCCCPGFVKTDMSSHRGVKTTDEGADTPVWLALLPPESTVNGKFFADRAERTWIKYASKL